MSERRNQNEIMQDIDALKDMYVGEVQSHALDVNFLQGGFIRLPQVEKRLFQGPRGAIYYFNPQNRRVYLNNRMKEKYLQNNLSGCVGDLCHRGAELQRDPPVRFRHAGFEAARRLSDEEQERKYDDDQDDDVYPPLWDDDD
jgi:hypothetical protein